MRAWKIESRHIFLSLFSEGDSLVQTKLSLTHSIESSETRCFDKSRGLSHTFFLTILQNYSNPETFKSAIHIVNKESRS
uniref:Uncharacterized protein n=1 Tax=Lepeophtheirus salmonis TaxID=72036 RepID=A0A0K2UEK1_LEPSM